MIGLDDLELDDDKGIKSRIDVWKARIRAALKVSTFPRTDWSFVTRLGKDKTPVEWSYITYMSKGNLTPLVLNNVPVDYRELTAKWVPMMGTNMKVQYKVVKSMSTDELKKNL